ncbi:hypothetical protein FA95DRAFT_1575968 [Auriscalpium vulgare]|uniref:Uncharacterized protein n=1 Tax=Auriscalpium vulgare TaxID=40419 RepID=A0ACB8REN4_9AGAM|nr:hypothetical protein FA95DRAFT_1575968 [Auriscalpium vulgare]
MTSRHLTQATLSPHAGSLLPETTPSPVNSFHRLSSPDGADNLGRSSSSPILHGAGQTQHASSSTSFPPLLSPLWINNDNTKADRHSSQSRLPLSTPFDPMLALRQDYLDYLDGHALPSPSPPQTATQLSYTRTRHSPGPRASFSSVDSPGHLPLRPPELYLPSPGLDNNGSTTTYEDKAGQYFPRHTLQAPVPQTYASPRDQVAQDQVQQLDYAPVGAQSRQRSEQPAAQHAYGHPQASGSHAVCDTSVASQHNAGQMASTLASPVAKAPRIHTNPKDRKRVEQQNIRDITNHWVDNMKITLGLNHKLSKNKTLEKGCYFSVIFLPPSFAR